MIEEFIDLNALRGQYAMRPAFVIRLLTLMHKSHAETPARLRMAVDTADLATLAAEAHRLKGVLGNLYATPKLLCIIEIERLAKAGDSAALPQAAAYAQTLDAFLAALDSYVADQGPQAAS